VKRGGATGHPLFALHLSPLAFLLSRLSFRSMPRALWDRNRVYSTDGVRRLNAYPDEELRGILGRVCADPRWVEGMAGTRPFKDEADVYGASERLFERFPDLPAAPAAVAKALEALLTV